MVQISLTSVPPRFPELGARLEELLAQGADGVTLVLPAAYLRFPDWNGTLPALPLGVEVLRAPDMGPATKFVTAFRRYPDRDVLIADDDCRYRPGWLAAFAAARLRQPRAAIAASAFEGTRLGLPAGTRIAQGFGGILLTPQWLDPSASRPGNSMCWVDDIWLSAHAALARLPIVTCPEIRALVEPLDAPAALQRAEIGGADRATLTRRAVRRLQERYGVWR